MEDFSELPYGLWNKLYIFKNWKLFYFLFSAATLNKLEINMVGLQNNYENIKKEVQALEEHIKCAKAIQKYFLF